MKPTEIKAAMLKSGALNIYLGTKWSSHYDPQASTYSKAVHERHGNVGPIPPWEQRDKWRRCSAFVSDEDGWTTLVESLCDCHKGEWLSEPEPWAVALLELLDNCEQDAWLDEYGWRAGHENEKN